MIDTPTHEPFGLTGMRPHDDAWLVGYLVAALREVKGRVSDARTVEIIRDAMKVAGYDN